MRSITAVIISLLLLLGVTACGDDDDQDSAPSTAYPSQPTSASPQVTDAGTQAEVLNITDQFNADHPKVIEAYVKTLGPLPAPAERVQQAITTACRNKAKGFETSKEEVGLIALFFGQAIQESGQDISQFLDDVKEKDKKVAELVKC